MAGPTLSIKPLGALAQAITQLFQPPPVTIRGIETTDWFGPLQPVRPIAPEGTEPRRFQYYPGQNLIYTPRANEPYSADQLRQVATYPLARVLIENVKDALTHLPLNVRLKRLPGETGRDYAKRKPDNGILRAIDDVLQHPNPEQNRQEFLRGLIEDMLVIDAASVLMRTTKKGELIELRGVDGGTITRYIDEQGYTPQPPNPAYAQVWYGIPMVDLTTRHLLYAARNILPHKIYGMGPVEQALIWIQIGMERLQFRKAYYEEGTIPDAIQVVPPYVTADKISESQQWLNSDLSGQLGKRRQIRLVQGFDESGKDQFLFPKQVLLSDAYDELEINSLCFAFGVSRQRLAKMMNRASAESDQAAAEKEGIEPWMDWAENGLWNKIIQDYLGFEEYEVAYEDIGETDPMKQSQIDEIDIKIGKRTINECREDNGDEARPEPEADQLMIYTASGPVPLALDQEIERSKKKQDAGLGQKPGEQAAGAPGATKPPAAKPPAAPAPASGGEQKSLVAVIEKLSALAKRNSRNGRNGHNGHSNGKSY